MKFERFGYDPDECGYDRILANRHAQAVNDADLALRDLLWRLEGIDDEHDARFETIGEILTTR